MTDSVTLREYIEAQVGSLGRRLDDALGAQKELVAAAFAASETAIAKAEDAQRAYNASHNDLLRKQDAMIPRTEFDAALERLNSDVASLRESRSSMRGGDEKVGQLVKMGLAGIAMLNLILAIVFFLILQQRG